MKFPFSRFTVYGHSMLPTLKMGQEVLTFNWWKILGLKVGDRVVVRVNGKELVKRIHTLNDRSMYVLGDNEGDSLDSRKFGAIKKEQIVGKVIFKL